MLSKAKHKLIQFYQKELGNLSEGTTNIILQRDLIKRQFSYSKSIVEAFDYFMRNYILVLDYLEKDFKQKNIFDPSGKDKDFKDTIKSERTALLEQKVKFGGMFNRSFMKYGNPKKIANTTRQWLIVNQFFYCYPILLSQLKKVSGVEVYKEINIKEEHEVIEKYNFLVEDFFSIVKKIKEDRKKNG